MFIGRKILIFSLVILCVCVVFAKRNENSADELLSPSASSIFEEISCDLSYSTQLDSNTAQQALIFLNASFALDKTPNNVLTDLIQIISQLPGQDYSLQVRDLLVRYSSNESADFEVFRQSLQYLLGKLDSREKRETLISELGRTISGKNAALESELMTMLGAWAIERADFNSAIKQLSYAYSLNTYNKEAFARLSQLVPGQIEESANLERLKLANIENPMNLDAALAFAQYAEDLQMYELAADGYEYCVQLFEYLYPAKPLPSWIYLPWALTNYNIQRNSYKCLQIAKKVRDSGRFDLFLEAVAAKAANKVGDIQSSGEILKLVSGKIQKSDSNSSPLNSEHVAWFYCFGSPDANEALIWANKAYSKDPNSSMAAALLGYALIKNGQTQFAKSLIGNGKKNQIADLAMAEIQIADANKTAAIETLKSVISMDSTSLVAQKAQEILKQQGGTYIKPFDSSVIMQNLEKNFGTAISPKFSPPEKVVSLDFNFKGGKFGYGLPIDGSVAVRNISEQPLVITDDGLVTGVIRVDANITGDLTMKMPEVFTIKIQPTQPIKPGQSLLVPMRLMKGQFKELLLSHPQASLDIEFIAYIDPVIADKTISNRLVDLKPAKMVIKRPRLEITGKYLQNRFDSLNQGTQGPMVQTSQLFVGLLLEEHLMANREKPLYEYAYKDWMPKMLKSAIIYGLVKSDWIGRVQIMSSLVPLPLDYEITAELSKNLSDNNWPIRMMAIYLLSKSQGDKFKKVLDWTAEYDSKDFVRDIAVALGGKAPQPKPQIDANAPAGSIDTNKPAPKDANKPVSTIIEKPVPVDANKPVAPEANKPAPTDANDKYISKMKELLKSTDANKPLIKDVNQRITSH